MSQNRLPSRETVLESLKWSDEQRREERADRLQWLSQHNTSTGGVLWATHSEMEVFELRDEAQRSYIEGLYIGTVLLAMAFVEQTIVARVLYDDPAQDASMYVWEAIKLARARKLFDEDLLDRALAMGKVRNACAHLRTIEHEFSFSRRWLAQKVHPDAVRDSNARNALVLMDDYFATAINDASDAS